MKTIKNIYLKVVALAAIAIAFAMPAKAQLSDNGYANIDWQFNLTSVWVFSSTITVITNM